MTAALVIAANGTLGVLGLASYRAARDRSMLFCGIFNLGIAGVTGLTAFAGLT